MTASSVPESKGSLKSLGVDLCPSVLGLSGLQASGGPQSSRLAVALRRAVERFGGHASESISFYRPDWTLPIADVSRRTGKNTRLWTALTRNRLETWGPGRVGPSEYPGG